MTKEEERVLRGRYERKIQDLENKVSELKEKCDNIKSELDGIEDRHEREVRIIENRYKKLEGTLHSAYDVIQDLMQGSRFHK